MEASFGLFLLPGGRPRRRTGASPVVIQSGGLPRRFPRPLASLSKIRIASSIADLSCRNSANILLTSIFCSPKQVGPELNFRVPVLKQEQLPHGSVTALAVVSHFLMDFKGYCSEFRTIGSFGTWVLSLPVPKYRHPSFSIIYWKLAASNENKRVILPK